MEETTQPGRKDLNLSILHQGALCQELWNLRTEGMLCDVIIATGNEQLRAHRIILSACSPYLKACCMNPPTISQDGLILINVHAYSFKVCLKLVEFLYTGKPVDFCGAILEEYKQLCADWSIPGLTGVEAVQSTFEDGFSIQKKEDCGETMVSGELDNLAGYTGQWEQRESAINECHGPQKRINPPIVRPKKQKAPKQPAKRGRKRRNPDTVSTRQKRACTTRSKPAYLDEQDGNGEASDETCETEKDKQFCSSADAGLEDSATTEDRPYEEDTDIEENIPGQDPETDSEANGIRIKATTKMFKTTRSRRKRTPRTKIIDGENSSEETNNGGFQCRVCGEEVESKAELDKHRRKEHKNKRQAWCKKCKTRFPDKNQLKAHEVANHFQEGMEMPKLYACQEEGCAYQTYNRKSWFGHKSFVHQPERSICDLCGKSLKSEASLKQHKHLVHVIALSKEYPCDSCDKIFRSVCGLQRHKVNIHSISKVREKHICPHCGLTCLNVSTMTEHLYKKHDLPPPPGKTGYKCQHCDFKSLKVREVRNHELRHFPDKQFSCEDCGRSYPTKRELTRHKRLHSNTFQVHKCPHCDYSTKYGRGALRSHIQVKHEDGRPWVCSICAYRTKLKGNLHKHIRNVHKCEVKTNWTLPKLVDGSNTDRYNVPKGVAFKSVEPTLKGEGERRNEPKNVGDMNITSELLPQTSRDPNAPSQAGLDTGANVQQTQPNMQIPASVEQIHANLHSHAHAHINFGFGHSHPLAMLPPNEKLGSKMEHGQFDILTTLSTDASSLANIPHDPLMFTNINI